MNGKTSGMGLNRKGAQEFPLGSKSLHSLVAKLGSEDFVVLADGDADARGEFPFGLSLLSPLEEELGRRLGLVSNSPRRQGQAEGCDSSEKVPSGKLCR